jgi:hypothetical protein
MGGVYEIARRPDRPLSRLILVAQIAAISRVHASLYEPAGVGIIWSFN